MTRFYSIDQAEARLRDLSPLLEKLRVELLIEVKSAAGTGSAGYQYALSDAGRNRALRYFEAEKLLDREDVAVLHAERRTIIEPVEIGQRLQVGLVLDQLLGAAVQ